MATTSTDHSDDTSSATVGAGMLSPWSVDELPAPPPRGLRHWRTMMGPGLLMAGAGIGAGEWLFGPAVSAQFGATLLWLATVSILCQVILNLEVMRYAIYCGEPILVGYFRTFPGPWVWVVFYLILEIASIWPMLAFNAAIPLSAALLGHLPGEGTVDLLGISENQLVKLLSYVIFVVSFIPLMFGGVVYRMIEKVMTFKIIVVLGFLVIITAFMVSRRHVWEVTAGLFRFGAFPVRAETIIDGRHFTFTSRDEDAAFTIQGTVEGERPVVTGFKVEQGGVEVTFGPDDEVSPQWQDRRQGMLTQALTLVEPNRFVVEDAAQDIRLRVEGRKTADGSWQPERFTVEEAGQVRSFDRQEQLPDAIRKRSEAWVANRGLERRNLVSYVLQHGKLPPLDWALLAAFFSIAGAGGITNSLLSNYARDKGWGMGSKVGAIPSAVGGRTISLSHTGKVFRISETSRAHWRGWMRHIMKDQLGVWMLGSFIGVMLPCMISLEFIRNAPVQGNRLAAMTADGIGASYPSLRWLLWSLTLFIGFLVLFPGLIQGNDGIARRWTDILWVGSKRLRKLGGNKVKFIYYGIMGAYLIWGLFALSIFETALAIATVSGVLGNIALGATALHTLYVNRTLLPREFRPSWFMQLGLLMCGICFLGISVVVIHSQLS